MNNSPRYTFGDRIFVKNEEAEVLGIWRAREVWYYKVKSLSQNPNIDALWWIQTAVSATSIEFEIKYQELLE